MALPSWQYKSNLEQKDPTAQDKGYWEQEAHHSSFCISCAAVEIYSAQREETQPIQSTNHSRNDRICGSNSEHKFLHATKRTEVCQAAQKCTHTWRQGEVRGVRVSRSAVQLGGLLPPVLVDGRSLPMQWQVAAIIATAIIATANTQRLILGCAQQPRLDAVEAVGTVAALEVAAPYIAAALQMINMGSFNCPTTRYYLFCSAQTRPRGQPGTGRCRRVGRGETPPAAILAAHRIKLGPCQGGFFHSHQRPLSQQTRTGHGAPKPMVASAGHPVH